MTRPPTPLYLDDVVTLRKQHPCGSSAWRIERLGADLGLRCVGCRRRVLRPRAEVERDITKFVERGPLAPVEHR